MVKHAEQNALLDIRNSKRKGVVSDHPWAHEPTRQAKERPRQETANREHPQTVKDALVKSNCSRYTPYMLLEC